MSSPGAELDEIQSIIEDFIVETDEIILSLENNIIRLEKESGNLELLNDIFRSAHTIKGTSGFLGFDDLTNFTHTLEDVLNLFRKGTLAVASDTIDVLLASIDIIKGMLDDIREKRENSVEYESVLNDLKRIRDNSEIVTQPIIEENKSGESTVKNDSHNSVEMPEAAKAEDKPALSEVQAAELPDKKSAEHTIRVDVNRLEDLMNISGELVLGRNTLLQITSALIQNPELGELAEALNQTATQINFVTSELQSAVMRIRMLPIHNVFSKFPPSGPQSFARIE